MPTIYILHYDTSTGRQFAQNLQTAQIEDLAVTSAKLEAAVIALLGSVDDGAIISAKLASGIVGSVHLADEAVTSGDIAGGIIATPHILDQGLLSASFGANVIATPHIINQGILSASIGATEIGGAHIANQALVSANYGSGIIATTHILAGGILSAAIGANSIGGAHILDGSITESDLASGISVDIAELAQEPSFRAQDLISAFLGIQFNISGYFNLAQAASISSLPAVGITTANILSGQIGTFHHDGRITNPAWNFSGYVGRMLFVGLSGEITLTAPSASGQCVQRLAEVVDKDTAFLKPDLSFIQIAV